MESMHVITFVCHVLGLQEKFPLSVTSWFRTPARNAAVHGHPHSRHMTGHGMDVVLDNDDDKPAFIRSAGRYGILVVDEVDHLHLQVRPK